MNNDAMRSFCKAKYMVNKTKWQPSESEKIFTNYTSDRELISKINKQLKELDTKIPNNPIKKWGTDLNREFSKMKFKWLKDI